MAIDTGGVECWTESTGLVEAVAEEGRGCESTVVEDAVALADAKDL